MDPASREVWGSGAVASHLNMARWRLLYLIEKGDLPGPSFVVAGRRLFTEEDIERIAGALKKVAGRPRAPTDQDTNQRQKQ